MSSKAMSLKAKIKNLSKEKGISAQVFLQNYMFELFLERLSKSIGQHGGYRVGIISKYDSIITRSSKNFL